MSKPPQDQRFETVIKRMLATPPKPHKNTETERLEITPPGATVVRSKVARNAKKSKKDSGA